MDTTTAIGATIGLMALAPASVLVITVGMVALSFYGTKVAMQ